MKTFKSFQSLQTAQKKDFPHKLQIKFLPLWKLINSVNFSMELFNTNQYPIYDLESMSSELKAQKTRYQNEGVMVLENFLSGECMRALLNECQSIGEQAYLSLIHISEPTRPY